MREDDAKPPRPWTLGRRGFLKRVGAGVAGALALGTAGPGRGAAPDAAPPARPRRLRLGYAHRRRDAFEFRRHCAELARRRNTPVAVPRANGEETDYPRPFANYSKGLSHDALGEVVPAAYDALLTAVRTGRPADFDAIPLGGVRKLTSPQAGLAFDLEGPDSASVPLRPAPRIDQPENSGEMAELYWMALARDVAFTDYAGDATIAAAAADLSRMSDFRGPKDGGGVSPATIFRGTAPGNTSGPFVSQFLLLDVPYGSLTINQRQRTVLPGIDFLTSYDQWLASQNGAPPTGDVLDSTPRYVRNLRDLAAYVHADALYEAYLNACLILLGLGAPFDPGLPTSHSANQIGFAEYGGPHVLSLVCEVATRALKAVWYEKWFVHRRQRPEEFGGRVHNHVTGAASYPIDRELLASAALSAIHARTGSYLMPQAFPEGAPTHPSYGSGHATVAGACVTVLKAFFDEKYILPAPVVPDPTGTTIVPWTGDSLTVGGELNKLAANIPTGRNAAGIHWRTDFSEALLLGEAIALGILVEQKLGHNQKFDYTLTTFDGTPITV